MMSIRLERWVTCVHPCGIDSKLSSISSGREDDGGANVSDTREKKFVARMMSFMLGVSSTALSRWMVLDE
jgi:hypothetical protein